MWAEKRPVILVVEDDDLTREMLVTRLELSGYNTRTARNGREALHSIQELRPHGMVLDVNMPEMDGFQLLEAMKRNGDIQRIPVLLLTARHTGADVQKAVALGARDYLAKPVDQAVFLNRIRRLLRKAQAPTERPGGTPTVEV